MTSGTEAVTKEAERRFRRIAPIATLLMILVAALIWSYGGPRVDIPEGPLPECAPPRAENVAT